jgi:hypothetical protein
VPRATYYDAEGRHINSPARVQDSDLRNIQLRGDRVFIAELACVAKQ